MYCIWTWMRGLGNGRYVFFQPCIYHYLGARSSMSNYSFRRWCSYRFKRQSNNRTTRSVWRNWSIGKGRSSNVMKRTTLWGPWCKLRWIWWSNYWWTKVSQHNLHFALYHLIDHDIMWRKYSTRVGGVRPKKLEVMFPLRQVITLVKKVALM